MSITTAVVLVTVAVGILAGALIILAFGRTALVVHRRLPPSLEPGTTLGPYSVTAKIGEAGMGEAMKTAMRW